MKQLQAVNPNDITQYNLILRLWALELFVLTLDWNPQGRVREYMAFEIKWYFFKKIIATQRERLKKGSSWCDLRQ